MATERAAPCSDNGPGEAADTDTRGGMSQILESKKKSEAFDTHFRVIVLGPVSSGKSSIIKRLVCHRFDNLPTYNSNFMGAPTDGIHMVRTELPALPPVGRSKPPTGADAARDILLELQDMLAHMSEESLRRAPTWYEMVPKPRGSGSAANGEEAATGGEGAKQNTPSSPGSTELRAMELQEAAAAEAELQAEARGKGKVRTVPPPELGAHPLMAVSFAEGKKQAQKEAARLLVGPGGAVSKPNSIGVEHGAKGW